MPSGRQASWTSTNCCQSPVTRSLCAWAAPGGTSSTSQSQSASERDRSARLAACPRVMPTSHDRRGRRGHCRRRCASRQSRNTISDRACIPTGFPRQRSHGSPARERGAFRVLLAKSAVESSDDIHVYKPFVDGLRAIAILAVVVGHLELPGASGGFVGVDVFFVISGYLIINQIAADIRAGRFSVLDFWARRALRILPAFLLVASVCLALAVPVLVQYEYRAFADSFFFSTLMQANHYFLSKQNYFENIAYAQPLLHTWSLSVEEQFYFVAPLALI